MGMAGRDGDGSCGVLTLDWDGGGGSVHIKSMKDIGRHPGGRLIYHLEERRGILQGVGQAAF